ncbi:MAG: transmembrane 220 family protein [Verrucomicrobiota bacterium]
MAFKILNPIFALIFAAFAWFQRNDLDELIYYKPSAIDSALWFAFYLVIAALFIWVIFRRVPLWLLAIAALACIVEMVVTGPGLIENLTGKKDFTITGVSMSAEDPRVELSREFFGALIALAAVVFIWWQSRIKGKR